MRVIIAEKPSVAMNIAKVIGASVKHDGYFEGNGYIVSFAFGHLLTLLDAKDYDESMSKWEVEKYPFIPEKFRYKLINDNGVKKQFNIIKELIGRNDVTEIINAADGDREGETLATEILKATGTKKPVRRLWISSYTPKDVFIGLENLKSIEEMKNLQDAGFARSQADWLIGINFTSVATLRYGNGNLLNIGRVIMPTVKLIYDRDVEIKSFKPKDFYELYSYFQAANGVYPGIYAECTNGELNTKFDNIEKLRAISNQVLNKTGVVVDKKVTISKRNSSKLFNLSDLQGYITSKYKDWTSDKVLKVAQSLYEKTYITYPRTPSRFLNDTQVAEAHNTLMKLTENMPYKDLVSFKENKSIFDSSKVDSHPALTPTYIIPNELNSDERIIYEEVKNRFIAQFMPAAEFENTEIITKIEGYIFKTKGKALIKKGWLELYNNIEEDGSNEDNDNEKEMSLPVVELNENVIDNKSEVLSKKTQPPSKYTEQSLLKAMELCGRNVSDEDVDSILSGYQIGTQATRGDTIKKIQEAGYVIKKGKSFSITDTGIRLVETLPVPELMDLDFTGKIELKLKNIEDGLYTKSDFMNDITEFTVKGIENMKSSNGVIGIKKERTSLGNCPVCKKGKIFENKAGYGCDQWKEGCKFFIGKIAGKSLTENQVKQLLTEGQTGVIKGFTGKKGKFAARLVLSNGKIEFDFSK